jgi:hypothetical protein
VKKKLGARGKQGPFCLSKIPLTNKKKRRVLVFNPPRGARTFHTYFKTLSEYHDRDILLIRREHSDLI